MARELSELLSEIKAYGWLVNNLFQIDEETWRCNLRRVLYAREPGVASKWFHEFCDGPTPEAAVGKAVKVMRKNKTPYEIAEENGL